MRSRASGVARLEAVAAPFILIARLLCILFIVPWTRDAGRAAAHPYHAMRCEPRRIGRAPATSDSAHQPLATSHFQSNPLVRGENLIQRRPTCFVHRLKSVKVDSHNLG
jgi:hypothetical protein